MEAADAQLGPLVHGRTTTISFFSCKAIASSPLLSSVISLINAAYATGRAYTPPAYSRLDSPQDFLSELEPDGRLFLLKFTLPNPGVDEFSPHGLVATGVYQPVSPRDQAETQAMLAKLNRVDAMFARHGDAAKQAPGVKDWTLKMMAVAPGCTRQGVGSAALRILEDSILERSRAETERAVGERETVSHPEAEGVGNQSRVRILATSWAEMGESFYTGRGFEVVARTRVPAGDEGIGGSLPFHVVHLDKWLLLR